ncbi:MAG: hypothetical protein QOD45_605 [Pseudonocardiales bacterium]|nr:hypothetical protein [Pseudonocardiales bacterium]
MRRTGEPLRETAVAAGEYDEAYYTSCCAGYQEWLASGATGEAAVFPVILERSGFQAGMAVCDIGAGRGELVALAAQRGASVSIGVEYAPAAVVMAHETVRRREVADRALVVQADARQLPVPDASIDRVFMLDVIEHLAPPELSQTLREAHRVLRPGGKLIGHTFPTSTIYNVTYRALRAGSRLTGTAWPADPRNEFEHRMHVNEQNRSRLRLSLWRAGFRRADVHFGEWMYTDFLPHPKARALYHRLARHKLTAPLSVADLWVYTDKRS